MIRYEDLVASGGRALAVIDPGAASLNASLESQNTNRLYDRSLVCELARRLIAESSIYEGFYTTYDIAALRDAWVFGRGA